MTVSLDELILMQQSTSALSCPLVLAYVRANGWSTAEEVSNGTGLSIRTVFAAMQVLRKVENKARVPLLPSLTQSLADPD